jgi:hypothetical protein
MATVMRFQSPETTKITALMVVMQWMKLKPRPEKKAGAARGRVIRRKVWLAVAPRSAEASSMLRSICRSEAIPARTPMGAFRNTLSRMMMAAVPVKSSGLELKARM